MEIYLLRHGKSADADLKLYPDDDRPLTEEGLEKIQLAAAGVKRILEEVNVVVSSPLKRAYETARIVARALGSGTEVQTADYMRPEASVTSLLSQIEKQKNAERVLLVGHEPHLGKVAATLLGTGKSPLEFKKGSLCCISVEKTKHSLDGVLRWHLTPKQLRKLGKKKSKDSIGADD